MGDRTRVGSENSAGIGRRSPKDDGTAAGFKHKKAFKNHILTKKSPKRKRQLRGLAPVADGDKAGVKRMLPGKAR